MTDPNRRPRAELAVDLGAIQSNVVELRRRVAPAEVMVVVKADAYGHGLVQAARAARAGGATWLGVAVLEEALALRTAGDNGRVLAWLAVPGEDYTAAVAAGIDLTAYSAAEVEEIADGARRAGRPARLQLKVDTGLARGGARGQDWPDLVRAACAAAEAGLVEITGTWSHLACSDEPDHPMNEVQERAFRDALDVASALGLPPGIRHLANSAAALTRPTARFDVVRCGLAAYGLSPVPQLAGSADLGLVPAMTARTTVALVKRVPAGTGVSYGHAHVTERETTLAVVPVGYGEGVLRSGSSVAPVQVAGGRHQVAGRVCMDQFVVDVADEEVSAGDEVVLFGPGTGGEPTAEEWARACGTISYEIVTRLGGRFVRTYAGGPEEVSR